MRIAKLQLPAYGHFQGKELLFGEKGECDFHIIFGSNEAGKSTLLRAISELLFGIHLQSPAKFRYGKNISLQAQLEQGDAALDFSRLNKQSDALQSLDGEPLPDSALQSYLYGLNRDTFESSYGISHERLRQGGKDITEAKGDLGQALLAATGIENIRPLLEKIEQQIRDLLSAARDKTQSFPALKKQYEALQQQIEEIEQTQSAEKYGQLVQELELSEKELAETQKVENELKGKRDQLLKRKSALPILKPYLEQLEALRTCADTPSLHEKVLQELTTQLQHHQEALQAVNATELELTKRRKQREAIEVNPEILKQKAGIEEVRDQRESAENREKEITKLQLRQDQLREAVESLIAQLQLDCDLEALEKTNWSAQQFEQWNQIIEKKLNLSAVEESCQQELQEIELTLQNQGDAADIEIDAKFESALEQASNHAQLPMKLSRQKEQIGNQEKQLLEALARLHYLSIQPDQLKTLKVPLKEEIEEFLKKFQTSDNQLQEQKLKLENHRKELEEAKDQLELEIQKAGNADPEQVSEARKYRDKGWQLIMEDWKGTGASEELEPGMDLAEAYEKSVKNADDAADQLFQNAETAGSIKARRIAIELKEGKTEALESAVEESQAANEELRKAWEAFWKPLRIEDPAGPEIMLAWWQEVQILQEQRVSIQNLQTEWEAETVLLKKLETDLRKALEQTETEADFLTLIKSANQILQSKNLIAETRQKQKRSQLQLKNLQNRAKEFASEWAGLLESLEMEPESSVESAQSVASSYEELFQKFQEYQRCSSESAMLRKLSEAYNENVDKLAKTFLAKEIQDNANPAQLARHLANELEAAQHNQTSAQVYEQQIQETELTLQDAQRRLSKSKEVLDQSYTQYGCPDEEALRKLLQRAHEKADLEKELAKSKNLLAEQAGELSLGDFIEELRGVQDIELQLLETESDATHALNLTNIAREKVISIRKDLDQFKSFDQTIERLRSDQGGLEALIFQQAQTYTKLTWMENFLSDEIRKAEEASGGTLLKRAGELFHELTLEAYDRLDTDLDAKHKLHLVGMRTHNDAPEMVKADEMSDGTQDQMFLALRLAWLEERLQQAPMPIILDDLLVNFDDERSQAILKVLANLSRNSNAQILLFTHHQHVLELAGECLEQGKDFLAQDLAQNDDDPF